MINIDEISKEIAERLSSVKPFKVYLFGSYAYGTPNENSDIDLMVVLEKDKTSHSFVERMADNLMLNKKLLDINSKYPIDLIVISRSDFNNMISDDNSNFKQLIEKAKVIL